LQQDAHCGGQEGAACGQWQAAVVILAEGLRRRSRLSKAGCLLVS
jgi:hypothetical protein